MSRTAMSSRFTTAAALALLVALALTHAPVRGASATIVINEFRTRGLGGASDEFVELRNVGGTEISIAGWKLVGVDGLGAGSTLVTLPGGAVVKPGCYYLIISKSDEYSGVELGDVAYDVSTRVPDNGGFVLANASDQGIDQVGMSVLSNSWETAPLTPLSANADQSYTRSSTVDTDNNPADFTYTLSPSPTNYDPAGCPTGRTIRRP